MSVYEGSRYSRTPLFNFVSGVPLLRVRQAPKYNLKKSATYQVKPGDRIDSIAHKLYGNAQLYWAIMDANPRYFSELEIQAGDVLIIPSYEEVMKYV